MRNGVIAITRDGHIAVMNDVAYRIARHVAGARPTSAAITPTCCTSRPNGPRPRRRLRGRAPARTAPSCGSSRRARSSATRCRRPRRRRRGHRRDAVLQGPDPRRAARGTRAAARSPGGARRDGRGDCARGEEPAGGHRGDGRPAASAGWPSRPRRRRRSTDIINEAKMANAIVIEVLDFVRPVRLQVEPVPVAACCTTPSRWPRALVPRGDVALQRRRPRRAAADPGRRRTSCASCSPTW